MRVARHGGAHRGADILDVMKVDGVEVARMHTLEAALDASADRGWRVIKLILLEAIPTCFRHLSKKEVDKMRERGGAHEMTYDLVRRPGKFGREELESRAQHDF